MGSLFKKPIRANWKSKILNDIIVYVKSILLYINMYNLSWIIKKNTYAYEALTHNKQK